MANPPSVVRSMVIAALLFSSAPTAARATVPSEQELIAAFCIGVIDSLILALEREKADQSTATSRDAAIRDVTIAASRAKRIRLELYLLERRIEADTRRSARLTAALDYAWGEGTREEILCRAELIQSKPSQANACERVKACGKANASLPFLR